MTTTSDAPGDTPQRTKNGTWVSSCPNCGSEKRIKNLTFVTIREFDGEGVMCTNCREGRDDDQATVALELDLCGCADEDRVDALMLEYLGRVEELQRLSATVPSSSDLFADPAFKATFMALANQNQTDTMMLMSHLADRLEWTDHGSSIRACWLTTGGKEALAILRTQEERLTERRHPRNGDAAFQARAQTTAALDAADALVTAIEHDGILARAHRPLVDAYKKARAAQKGATDAGK